MSSPSPARRPQPVLTAAQASAVATWLTALLVGWLGRQGWLLPTELSEPITDLVQVGIVAAAAAISGLLGASRARNKVTPLADPRDQEGVQLVPVRKLPPVPLRTAAAAPPAAMATNLIERVSPSGPAVDVAALRAEYGLD